MKAKNEEQFEAQKKALKFQEMYYPSNTAPLNQKDQSEAIRFAFAMGWEMAQRAIQDSK